jgi:hypothetical protein
MRQGGLGLKLGTNETSSSGIITRKRNSTMSRVIMQDLSGFGLTPSMRYSLIPLRRMVYPVGWTMANMWV